MNYLIIGARKAHFHKTASTCYHYSLIQAMVLPATVTSDLPNICKVQDLDLNLSTECTMTVPPGFAKSSFVRKRKLAHPHIFSGICIVFLQYT